MAANNFDITPDDWRIGKENVIQLYCENVSWEQASDKIPLDLVRYLLGDLVQYLSTLVFLGGNRCLFTIDWTQIPDSVAVLEYMLNYSFEKKTPKQVRRYMFIYKLSHVGPRYDDLVEIYCHAHWGNLNPKREDVWESGKLYPWDRPEMFYLSPNLTGSTPKKATTTHLNAEDDSPDLEEMGHKDLVDLVKRLLEERTSKPAQLTNPKKDATVAGHVTMNQESFVQSRQAILQGLAEGEYVGLHL